jgi:hypothetical protein
MAALEKGGAAKDELAAFLSEVGCARGLLPPLPSAYPRLGNACPPLPVFLSRADRAAFQTPHAAHTRGQASALLPDAGGPVGAPAYAAARSCASSRALRRVLRRP